MLFVFSMLLLKSAFRTSIDTQDCHEFAHIHKFYFQKTSVNSIPTNGEIGKTNNSDSCHAGNILSGLVTLTTQKIICEILINDKVSFKVPFENSFYLSPFLDLPKQPPKKLS